MSVESVRGLGSGTRAAVVVHEWQRGMVDRAYSSVSGLAAQATDRTANINAVTASARRLGVPVIWSVIEPRQDKIGTADPCMLLHGLRKGGLVVGSVEAELEPSLVTDESDIWVRRVHGLTPFHGTELESYLRHLGVGTIVLCGVSVDVGIAGGAIEAVNRGFSVVIPSDCVAASSQEVHDFMLRSQLRLLATISDSASVVTALQVAATVED